jgi:hypothetical protein
LSEEGELKYKLNAIPIPDNTNVNITEMNKVIIIIILFLNAGICFSQDSQYNGKLISKQNVKKEILIDSLSGNRFLLDKEHINITAINNVGDTIWQTDPIKQIKMEPYRINRPIIVTYEFQNNERTEFKEVIWIVYNNSQFGTIEKETGNFTFYGQN